MATVNAFKSNRTYLRSQCDVFRPAFTQIPEMNHTGVEGQSYLADTNGSESSHIRFSGQISFARAWGVFTYSPLIHKKVDKSPPGRQGIHARTPAALRLADTFCLFGSGQFSRLRQTLNTMFNEIYGKPDLPKTCPIKWILDRNRFMPYVTGFVRKSCLLCFLDLPSHVRFNTMPCVG